jgi:hypothetical protein
MKILISILLLIVTVSCFSQDSVVVRVPVGTATALPKIKTINGQSLQGEGDIPVVAGSTGFANITGVPADNASLTTALNLKANVLNMPVYARVTGSNATTTGQVLVDAAGLSVALVANGVYEFEAVLSTSTSAVTTGTAYGINYSAAGATIEAHITGASTATATKTLRISAFNSATTLFQATSGQTGGMVIRGTVTTGANAGNLTVQHLKLTSGTSTIFIGSFLKVTRIQ